MLRSANWVELKPAAAATDPHGCPTFAPAYVGRKRWAKPTTAFRFGPYLLFVRTGTSVVDDLRSFSPGTHTLFSPCVSCPVPNFSAIR
jgi:hypothetical protein